MAERAALRSALSPLLKSPPGTAVMRTRRCALGEAVEPGLNTTAAVEPGLTPRSRNVSFGVMTIAGRSLRWEQIDSATGGLIDRFEITR